MVYDGVPLCQRVKVARDGNVITNYTAVYAIVQVRKIILW